MDIKKRRRRLRAILRKGLEAALFADPEVLEKCKPKTGVGLIARGLVIEGGKGKATPLKTLMSLVDREEEESEESGDTMDDKGCDWDGDGVWQTRPDPAAEQEDETARMGLRQRLERLIEAGDYERVHRVACAMYALNPAAFDEPPEGPWTERGKETGEEAAKDSRKDAEAPAKFP